MHFFHAVLPDEPEEGAEGPLPLRPGKAEGAPEGGIVHRHVVKGPEGDQRKPDWGGPQPPGCWSLRIQFHLRPCPQKPKCAATDPRDLKGSDRTYSVLARAKTVVRYLYS